MSFDKIYDIIEIRESKTCMMKKNNIRSCTFEDDGFLIKCILDPKMRSFRKVHIF